MRNQRAECSSKHPSGSRSEKALKVPTTSQRKEDLRLLPLPKKQDGRGRRVPKYHGTFRSNREDQTSSLRREHRGEGKGILRRQEQSEYPRPSDHEAKENNIHARQDQEHRPSITKPLHKITLQ